jgi:hypothetical protein
MEDSVTDEVSGAVPPSLAVTNDKASETDTGSARIESESALSIFAFFELLTFAPSFRMAGIARRSNSDFVTVTPELRYWHVVFVHLCALAVRRCLPIGRPK